MPVERKEYEIIVQHPWVKELIKKTKADFQINGDTIYLPKSGGICIFLNEKTHLCSIHGRLGADIKPIECHRFPFAFAKDSAGNIYPDTSFFCKAIVQNYGEDLSQLINEDYVSKFDTFDFPDKVLFAPWLEVDYSFAESILDLLSRHLYNECLKVPTEDWWDILYNGFKALVKIEKCIKNKEDKPFEEIINSFKKPASKRKRNLLTAIFLRKQFLIPDIFFVYFNKTRFLEPIIAEHIKLNRFKEVLFAGSEKTRNLLLKYYIDIIRRKVLLAHGHSVIGVYMAMLIAYCITRWYSKALVIVEGNSYSEVEDFHSELAVRVTERYYIGHNVKFMEPFRLHSRYILIKWFISI